MPSWSVVSPAKIASRIAIASRAALRTGRLLDAVHPISEGGAGAKAEVESVPRLLLERRRGLGHLRHAASEHLQHADSEFERRRDSAHAWQIIIGSRPNWSLVHSESMPAASTSRATSR